MQIIYILVIFSGLTWNGVQGSKVQTCEKGCPNVKTPLSLIRKRRQLIFPSKTFLTMTFSVVKTFMVQAPSGWYSVAEIDLPYMLPDGEFVLRNLRKKLRHRQRREIWEKMQDALDFQNVNGRACIMKAACEARSRLAPRGQSLVHDILRAIFSAPYHHEDGATEFAEEMDPHYHDLRDPDFCDERLSETECPVSILDFILSLNKPH